MKEIKKVIDQNRLFFIGYVGLLIFGATLLFSLGKVKAFYALNPYHHPWLNDIFYFFTILGDGVFVVPMAFALLLIKEKKLFWLNLSTYCLSGIIVLTIKNFVDEARPSVFEGLKNYPYFIDQITLHNFHGFPSGHTASAFAAACMFAFNSRSKTITALVLLLIAALVGYSRVYLGEHFISDVMVGSVIGIFSSLICWAFIDKKMPAKSSGPQVV